MAMRFNDVINPNGYIVPGKLAEALHITKEEFAAAVGLPYEAITHGDYQASAVTQQRLYQVTEILKHIEPWAGSLGAAWSWYRSYPISPLGGLTAEELLKQGRASDVREYLYNIADVGYS